MGEVAEACQLMKQALEILDARGEHQSAGILDMAIHALPGKQSSADWPDELSEPASRP